MTMRTLILALIATVLVVLVSRTLALFTGDRLSAVIIELIVMIALVSGFTRGPVHGRY